MENKIGIFAELYFKAVKNNKFVGMFSMTSFFGRIYDLKTDKTTDLTDDNIDYWIEHFKIINK